MSEPKKLTIRYIPETVPTVNRLFEAIESYPYKGNDEVKQRIDDMAVSIVTAMPDKTRRDDIDHSLSTDVRKKSPQQERKEAFAQAMEDYLREKNFIVTPCPDEKSLNDYKVRYRGTWLERLAWRFGLNL